MEINAKSNPTRPGSRNKWVIMPIIEEPINTRENILVGQFHSVLSNIHSGDLSARVFEVFPKRSTLVWFIL